MLLKLDAFLPISAWEFKAGEKKAQFRYETSDGIENNERWHSSISGIDSSIGLNTPRGSLYQDSRVVNRYKFLSWQLPERTSDGRFVQ